MDGQLEACGQLDDKLVRRAAGQRLGGDPQSLSTVGDNGEVRRQRQLLQAHQLRSRLGRQLHARGQNGPVLGGVGVP